MKFLYFLVTGAAAYNDKLNAFKTYFEGESGFTVAFLWALGIAFIFAIVYYICCFASYNWAKMGTWWGTLVVAACVSYAATGWETGMYSQGRNADGIRHTVEQQYKKHLEKESFDKDTLDKEKQKLQRSLDKGMFRCTPIWQLCLTNLILTVFFFWVFSWCFNGFSKHGAYIPHPGLYKP